ncbi:MAG: DUF3198 domain-containing protein [Thermoplasmata archaeon]|jgi:hypothetical protein|nr:DUF3198 domain-containing protein [Thermoplasmata archaeon]MCI4337944.1 DUF3198 domain-containing protein [Thermoplasmata archaeon]MCI4340822.1 DUF3198 domain-containing protein [Thermoplasmata archaeon]
MAGEGSDTGGRKLRVLLRTHRFLVAVVIFGAGLLLSTLALGYFLPISSDPPFNTINGITNQPNGANYNLLFVIAGPIVAIVGAYFVGAYLVARRKFEHLMQTRSKAEFLRHIPELEQLLWELTPHDEQRYFDKRIELRVRR